MRIVSVAHRLKARDLLLHHPPLSIQCHRARPPYRRRGDDLLRALGKGARVRSAIDHQRVGLAGEAQGVIGVRQRRRACSCERGRQSRRQHDRQTLRDGRLHPKARIRPFDGGRDRPVRCRDRRRPVQLDQRRCEQPAGIGHLASQVPRGQILHLIRRGPIQRRAQCNRPAGALLRPRQGLEAIRRILVFDEPPLGVIRELMHTAARIGQRRQEAIGGVGQLRCLAGGVRDRGTLATRHHDARRYPRPVPLDRRHLTRHVRHGREQATAVIGELVFHRAGQRIQRAQMAPEIAEDIDFAAVLGGHEQVAAGEAGKRRRDPANAAQQIIRRLGDIQRAILPEAHSGRPRHLGCGCRAPITAEAGVENPLAGPGQGVDDLGLSVDPANTVMVIPADVDGTVGAYGHADGFEEPGLGGRPAVPGNPRHGWCPGDGRDDAFRVDAPDCVVEGVGYIHGAVRPDGDAPGNIEPRLHSRPSVPRIAGDARAGEGVDDPVCFDTPDPMVGGISNIEGPIGTNRERPELGTELRGRGGTAVAAEAGCAGAGEGRDNSLWIDAPDTDVVALTNIETAIWTQGQP